MVARDAHPRALRSTLSAAADRDFRSACRSVLTGYGEAIDRSQGSIGRRPIILAEGEDTAWLRDIVVNKLRTKDGSSEFTKFLESLNDLPNVKGDVPESAWHALQRAMPHDVQAFRVGHRKAGLGSLGRQRFTAVVDDWHGGVLAREAKALAPSAWRWWTEAGKRNASYLYMTIVGLAVRSRDPDLSVHEAEQRWVVRRLAPDSGRVKLANLPKDGQLEDDLLRAMGHETANVHIPLGDVSHDFAAPTGKGPGLAVPRGRHDGRHDAAGLRRQQGSDQRSRDRPGLRRRTPGTGRIAMREVAAGTRCTVRASSRFSPARPCRSAYVGARVDLRARLREGAVARVDALSRGARMSIPSGRAVAT